MEVDDQKSSATHEVHQDTLDASGFHQTSPAITSKGRSKAWQPRQHASHIFKGANGTWYMRLAVPPEIRARYPDLPKELKRSTETPNRQLAATRARKMCLDFLIKYTTGESPMQLLDAGFDNSFSIVFKNGALHSSVAQGASTETILLMARCVQLVTHQICGRSSRTDAVAANGSTPICIPAPMDTNPLKSPSPVGEHLSAVSSNELFWLSDAIEDWCANGSSRFSDVTWNTVYKPSFRVFRELVGIQRRDRIGRDGTKQLGILDICVQDLTRKHIAQFRELLKELPPNQGKRTNEQEAMLRIEEGREKKTKPPSRGSVSKKVNHLSAFFEFSGLKGWIGQEVLNEYALAKSGAEKDALEESDEKNPGYVALTDSELHTLFEQPAFLQGALKADWRYWIPLICLHLGCRVSEAAQLYTDDIIRVKGVDCISFIVDQSEEDDVPENQASIAGKMSKKKQRTYKSADEFRRLKTKSSRRIIPIHPKLIELGFLEFVSRFHEYSSRPQHLFSDLRWEEKSMFGRYPSQHVLQLLKDGGIWKKYKKVGHSLRSNFKQALEGTMLPDNLQQRLLGHSTKTMKDERYNETDIGPAFPAAEVLPYLAKVDFGLCVPTWHAVQRQLADIAIQKARQRPSKAK